MKRRLSQRGASLIETMMAVGILGIIAYFVIGMLKTGTMGTKNLQTQDDARSITETMASILSDPIACANTFGGTSSTINPVQDSQTIGTVRDASPSPGKPVFTTGEVYGNRTLKLASITVGGTGADAKTQITKWLPNAAGPGGTAFVSVAWVPTGVGTSNQSGVKDVSRFFLLKVLAVNGTGTILSCSAQSASTAGGGGGYWGMVSATPKNKLHNFYNGDYPNTGIGTQDPRGVFDVFAGTTHAILVSNSGQVAVGTDTIPSVAMNAALYVDGKLVVKDTLQSTSMTSSMNLISPTSGWNFKISDTTPAVVSISPSGNVNIGMTAGLVALQTPGDISAANFISSSDERLKTNIRESEGLESILRLRGVNFSWRKTGQAGMGFIAQEVEKIFPDVVYTDKASGFKGIRYDALLAPLVESVKKIFAMLSESDRRIAALESRLQALEARLEKQNKELAALRKQ